jgi:hypothetical protein
VVLFDYRLYCFSLSKSAGLKRNIEMAAFADILIAFWDGESKGTKHMIEFATQVGLKVKVIFLNNSETSQ